MELRSLLPRPCTAFNLLPLDRPPHGSSTQRWKFLRHTLPPLVRSLCVWLERLRMHHDKAKLFVKRLAVFRSVKPTFYLRLVRFIHAPLDELSSDAFPLMCRIDEQNVEN